MSENSYDPKATNNYDWFTPERVRKFLKGQGVSLVCDACDLGDEWWIDAGSDDGYVPRLAAMPQLDTVTADTSRTFQMPVARLVCVNCGNVRHHALFVLQRWREMSEQFGMPWGSRNLFDKAPENGNE